MHDEHRPSEPPLDGRHVRLRPVTAADHRLLQVLDTSPYIAIRWLFRGETPSPERWARGIWANTLAHHIVVAKADDRPIGVVLLYKANLTDGHATLAAARFDPHKPSPLMTLGLSLFLNYAFTCWDLRKIYMQVPEYNYAQFASGVGRYFQLEGRLRDHYSLADRRWDQLHLAVHRDRWLDGKRTIFRAQTSGVVQSASKTEQP